MSLDEQVSSFDSDLSRTQNGHDKCLSSGSKNVYAASQPVQRLSLPRMTLRTMDAESKFRRGLEHKTERYNQFAEFLGKTAVSNVPFKRADDVQQTVDEIAQIIKDAEEAIRRKSAQLEADIVHFTADVACHADPRWYRNIDDLTAMEDTRFTDMLNMMQISDAEDFCAYLKDHLPSAAKRLRPDHEYTGRSFVGKLHMLLERLVRMSNTYGPAVMSLLVFVKAEVLLLDLPRVHSRFLQEEHAYVDDTIFWLLGQHSEADVSKQYWNFAQNWRVIVNAWEHIPAEPGSLMRLLDPFREKAELEIRSRTHLAINGWLPTELADNIFEAAMFAEEIPFKTQ